MVRNDLKSIFFFYLQIVLIWIIAILFFVFLHNYGARAIDFLSAHHRQYPFAELAGPAFPLSALSQAFAAADASSVYRVGVFLDTADK